MTRKSLLLLTLFLTLCLNLRGQDITVTGKVTDSSGEPLIGAAVVVDGTTNGIMVDIDGAYSLKVPSDAVLSFEMLGYMTQKIPVSGRSVINVVLTEDTQKLDEVIVVAFGTAKKEAFTGSAAVLNSEDVTKTQQSNVAQALTGKIAGVQLTNSSGQPGASPDIRIRGFSSLNAGNSPLWIVDGMPYSGDLGNLNSNDIESMTVLKDAASNALYGARGANGVIMVTTKKGRTQSRFNLDVKWGVNMRAVKDYDYITDPALYYETHYNALRNYYLDSGYGDIDASRKANANLTASAADGGLGYQVYTVPQGQNFIGVNGKVNPLATLGRKVVYKGQEYYVRPDDWTDAAYRHSMRQEYNASYSSFSEKTSLYMSFGYLNNKGIVANSDMERYTARVKVDHKAAEWAKIGANVTYANFDYNQIDDSGSSNSTANVFAYTSTIGPIYPLYLRDGSGRIMKDDMGHTLYDYGNGDNAGMERSLFPNSNALSDSRLNKSNSEGNAFNGTAYLDITFLKDFKLTVNAGYTLDETRSTTVYNPFFGQFATENGVVYKGHGRATELNLQQILNYNRQIRRHNINAMVGHEYYKRKSYSLSAAKSGMFSIDNDELTGAIIDKMAASSSTGMYNNEGYFTRVMYDYYDKYFASASYRRDASSRFHPDNRWGNFWSVGGAWIISKEEFMRKSGEWLDNLKLKASIGSQGNDNIGDYRYTDTFSITNSEGDVSTPFLSKGSKDITWETNINFNVGAEFGFLKGAISGSAEYFMRKTTDMLFLFPAAPSIGYSSYYANVGDMVNNGVEIELNFTPIRKENLIWDINLNATHMKNKITMLPEERRNTVVEGYEGYVSGTTFYGEGLPIYTFYLPKYAGVSDEGKSMWYMDDEKDGKTERTTTTDYAKASKYLCGNPIPDLYGGFGTSLSFFGFDFSVNFTWQIGGLAYDSGYADAMYSPANKNTGMNWHKDILKAWSAENPDSNIPRLQYEDQNQNASSDRFLTDASYLNLQNMDFGYTLPQKAVEKLRLSKLRIYLACENVWYCSRRRGFDPRHSYSGSTSQATYSPVRTISGGINIQF